VEKTKINIFSGVITNENSMTELLSNFMAYKPFRNAVLSLFLDRCQMDSINYQDISTQYVLNNNSRPDMVIINDEYEILFEVKTGNADLTDNQPTGYLEHLLTVNKNNKWLVLLIPPKYIHSDEWEKREALFLNKNSSICTKIIYWTDILREIERNDINIMGDIFSHYYQLLLDWFEIERIKFNASEVLLMHDNIVPDIIIKLDSIVNEVKDYNSKNCSKVKRNIDSGENGLYFYNEKGEYILYFGVWYISWKEHKHPLCYGIDMNECPKEIVKKFSGAHKDYIDFEDYRICFIPSNVLNNEDCTEEIAKLIESELKQLIT